MIRKADSNDLSEIAGIHCAAWHASYAELVSPEILAKRTPESSFEKWNEWFSAGHQELFVLTEGRTVQGFIRMSNPRPVSNPPLGFGELTHIYLDPSIVGKGKGHQLFAFSQQHMQSLGYSGMLLWTLEGNSRARRFYEQHMMKTDGCRAEDRDWLGEGVFEVRYLLHFGS